MVGGYIRPSGGEDLFVLKIDHTGNPLWHKKYGGGSGETSDPPNSIAQTPDGGYVLTGRTFSFQAGGSGDFWVLNLNANGDIVWQRAYGSAGLSEYPISVFPTLDGGYAVGGATQGNGTGDVWVLKLNGAGAVVWQEIYRGSVSSFGRSLMPTIDGGYIVAGETASTDAFILKLDATGSMEWERTYGGNGNDELMFVTPVVSGGYVAVGNTTSFGAGERRVWVLRVAENGDITRGCTFDGVASFSQVTSFAGSVDSTAAPVDVPILVAEPQSLIAQPFTMVDNLCSGRRP